MIFFKGQKAVLSTRANRDVANQGFSDLWSSVQEEASRCLTADDGRQMVDHPLPCRA
jgi:hypothetical protein